MGWAAGTPTWHVLLATVLLGTGCLVDPDQRCGPDLVDLGDGVCGCAEGEILDVDARACIRCGPHEVATGDACSCIEGYARDDAGVCAEVPPGLGAPCTTAADCVDAAYPVCQADDGYCTEACTTDDDCTGAFRCQLDGSPPFCQQPPTGLGTACEVAEDCEGLEADYCDSFFTGECLVSGCNLENDDCFVGLSCCDLSVFGLDEPICVEEGTCPF